MRKTEDPHITMTVGKKYVTRCGGKIECSVIADDVAICVYLETSEGHTVLTGKSSKWNLNGEWSQYPGGIHDVTKEV